MSPNLTLLGQQLLQNPIMCSESMALMLAGVFSGRFKIDSMIDPSGTQHDKAALDRMTQQGRAQADATRSKRRTGPWGELIDGEYFKRSMSGRIAVIDVHGFLTRTWGVESYSGTTGYDGIKMQFDDALRDDDIRVIWFNHDSGGGATNGNFDLARYIAGHGLAVTGKLTVGMAADYSFSASYNLLAACDKVYAPPTGMVGSVGVMALVVSYAEAMAKEGIDGRVLRYPEEKALSHPTEPIHEGYVAELYDQVRELGLMFQQMVAEHRGISVNSVAETLGRTYMGAQAKAIGFVDEVLPEPVVWAAMEEFAKLDGRKPNV
jgi:ClpP class serine protease